MTAKSIVDDVGLSQDQLDLIQHFQADYNAVDEFLREALGTEHRVPFTRLVKEYSSKHLGWRDADLLKKIAHVRNSIVHGTTEAYSFVAVPTSGTCQQLRACRDRLMSPAQVVPAFERKVETTSVEDSLTRVLKIIRQRDYSQFPVYEGECFCGLLTENGITRWLAHQVANDLSLVELDGISVKQVLENEGKRKNYQFVAQESRVDDVSHLFVSQEFLEAVLITQSGKESEALLGIATRWDMIHLP